ncbi:MAG: TIGR04013 family B12-binding domain/radical SAM domain-containing protein [Bacillota bacterium]
MKNGTAFVVYYNKYNRHSFNALIGAIEACEDLGSLKIYFPSKPGELVQCLHEIADKHDKVVAALSFFTTQLWETYEIVNNLKQLFNNKIVFAAGGPHPTGDPEGTLKLGFDIVFSGEGEESVVEFLKALKNGSDWENIRGIAYLDRESNYSFNGLAKKVDIDLYPPFPVKHGIFGPIEITRGCPFGCHYCQTSHLAGRSVRHRSIEKIVHYAEIMRSNDLTDLRVITPNAFSYGSKDGVNIDITKLEQLLSSVKKALSRNGRIFFGSFPSEVRPEHVNKETLQLVLEYASNDNIIIGGQSGSERMLELCKRSHKVCDIYRAAELTVNAGLKPYIDFIFGLPGETLDDLKETINVMKDLIKIGAKIHAHTFVPLPQTPFAKAPGGKVNKEIRQLLKDLSVEGIAYGKWVEQWKVGRKISTYLRSGRL